MDNSVYSIFPYSTEGIPGAICTVDKLSMRKKFWSGKRDSNSRPRPWQGRALPTELFPLGCGNYQIWSGKRDSNSRPRPWQGRALPTELFPLNLRLSTCRYLSSFTASRNPVIRIVPFKFWSGKRDSNSRPRPWQGRALPTELFPRTSCHISMAS